jgi:LPXTG-motif cell wall-anchored protein
MREIVFIIDNVHKQSSNWNESSSIIKLINDEIGYFKNLSFKTINIDTDAYARQDISVSGVTRFPWLRIFEDGKIIDNWDIHEGLKQSHWDNWSHKYGIKYTVAELNALNDSQDLLEAEKKRKEAETKLNEAKKTLENATDVTEKAKSNSNLVLIGGALAVIAAVIFFSKKSRK